MSASGIAWGSEPLPETTGHFKREVTMTRHEASRSIPPPEPPRGSWEAERTILPESEIAAKHKMLEERGIVSEWADSFFERVTSQGEVFFTESSVDDWIEAELLSVRRSQYFGVFISLELAEANQKICLPYVEAAIHGDEMARRQCCESRLVHYDDFPAEVRSIFFKRASLYQAESLTLCRQAIVNSNFISNEEAASYLQSLKRIPFDESRISGLGLRTFFTHKQGQAICRKLDEHFAGVPEIPFLDLSNGVKVRLTESQSCAPLRAGLRTPPGEVARRGLAELIELMFCTRLMMDYLLVHGISLPPSTLKRLTKTLERSFESDWSEHSVTGPREQTDPWEMLERKPFVDILSMIETLESIPLRHTHPELSDPTKLFERALWQKRPTESLQRHITQCIQGIKRQKQEAPDGTKDKPPILRTNSERAQFIEAVVESLHAFPGSFAGDPHISAKHLWSLRMKGGCTSEEVLLALRVGEDPTSIIERIRADLKARYPDSPRVKSKGAQEPAADVDSHELENQNFQIVIPSLPGNPSPFQKWYVGLSQQNQAKVDARLERYANGIPGQVKSTRSSNIFELKFYPSGLRVLFAYAPSAVEQNTLWILGGSTKGETTNQDADIKAAEALYLRLIKS